MKNKFNKKQAWRHLLLVFVCGLTALILGDIFAWLGYMIVTIFNNSNGLTITTLVFLFGPIFSIIIFSGLYRHVLLSMEQNKKLNYPVNLVVMVSFMTMLYIVPICFLVVLTMPWWFRI